MINRYVALAAALAAVPASAQDASSRISTTGTLNAPSQAAPADPAATPVVLPMAATAVSEPLPVAQAVPAGSNAVLRTGTELSLTLLQELTTKGKRLRVGDRVRLEVRDPLLMNGMTVIPQGAPVSGEVTEVRNKGMWGRSGRFVVRLLNVNVNGRHIRLGGNFDDKGKAGGWGAAAVSALVFLPAGFFMTGTSALLPAGTTVRAFIDEDVPLALPEVPLTPAVLTVAPSATLPVAEASPAAPAAVAADSQPTG